jgi:glycosyltransferase involved in cell wall biosynthesis
MPTEIIVINTGSSHRTKEIARQFGAQCHKSWVFGGGESAVEGGARQTPGAAELTMWWFRPFVTTHTEMIHASHDLLA